MVSFVPTPQHRENERFKVSVTVDPRELNATENKTTAQERGRFFYILYAKGFVCIQTSVDYFTNSLFSYLQITIFNFETLIQPPN